MQKSCRVNPHFGVMQVQQIYTLCQIARSHVDAALVLQKDERSVSCMQLIGLLTLLIHGDDIIVISATGKHADLAIASIEKFLSSEPVKVPS